MAFRYKRLDRYILLKYIETFAMALALIIVIIITFDVSEKLDKFISHGATLRGVVFDYYCNFIPGFVNLYSPLFVFISVLFFTSKMAGHTEIIAILGSGISYRRMLVPYLHGSLIVAAVVLVLGNFVIPVSNRQLIDFEEQYVRSKATNYYSNLHFQSEPGVQVYAESYDVAKRRAYRFRREVLAPDGHLLRRESADMITFDTAVHLWKSFDYHLRTIDADSTEHVEFHTQQMVDYGIEPQDFDLRSSRIETLNTPELMRHIERERMRGTGLVKEAEIELYQRLLNPIAIIVMTFIGVAIASRKTRGGIGMHLAIGITIAFAFILFMKITTVFATGGNLSPFMAVLLPQLVFGVATVYLIHIAPK